MDPIQKQLQRIRRAHRTRVHIHGTALKPRLSVSRSLKHISAQLINDEKGVTLAFASDQSLPKTDKPLVRAHAVGVLMAQKAKAAGIETVVFDRGSFRYHGRVAALADGAREGGLVF